MQSNIRTQVERQHNEHILQVSVMAEFSIGHETNVNRTFKQYKAGQ